MPPERIPFDFSNEDTGTIMGSPYRQMDIGNPMAFNVLLPTGNQVPITDQVDKNGVPNNPDLNGTSFQQKLLDMINGPETKAKMELLAKYQQQQENALGKNEEFLNNYEAQPTTHNWAPAAALVDTWTGSKLSQGVPKAQTPEERAKDILALRGQLQGQRQALTKDQIDLINSKLNPLSQLAMTERINQRGQSIGIAQDKLNSEAVDKVVNDPIIKAAIPRIQGSQRVLSQIDEMKAGNFKNTPQFLADINLEYTTLLTGRNNFAEGTAERTAYDNAATKWGNIVQQISSGTVDVRNPEVLSQIEGQINGLYGDWKKAIDDRASILQRGYKHNPEAEASQKKAIQDIIGMYGTGSKSPGAHTQPNIPPEDQAALEWLAANPNDPDAPAVKAKLEKTYGK
jgi:hypothetical protein